MLWLVLLGAEQRSEARQAFAQAMTLSLFVCVALIVFFALTGKELTLAANNGLASLAKMSGEYMTIVMFGSPLGFVLTINSDALRSEGHVGMMALVSILSVVLNGIANYVLIAILHLGVAGSAYGTLLAQSLSMIAVIIFRYRNTSSNTPVFLLSKQHRYWGEFLTLGAPSSLSYLGVSLLSAATLFNLQLHGTGDYGSTVSAYGILMRVMTFIFLPLLGLSLAFQSITGNNVGAKQYERTNQCITIALLSSLIYGLATQMLLWVLNDSLGQWFVNDPAVVAEVSRILPFMTFALFLLGPLMIISTFFQSIGDAARSGILGLSKTYLFALPLVFLLPLQLGEQGIWYAGPLSEVLAFGLTIIVLLLRSRQTPYRFGLYYAQL